MILKAVAVSDLHANPFRRLNEYVIDREKVEAVKRSIERTDFWGTIHARAVGNHYEIAFGHHRLIALRELGRPTTVPVLVLDMTNEVMLQKMAMENQEEWGSSAWVEVETVRATIQAYADGLIKLPPIPDNVRHKVIREALPGAISDSEIAPYTKAQIAVFLGQTKSANAGKTREPNAACELAFDALDLIAAGLVALRPQQPDLLPEQARARKASKLRPFVRYHTIEIHPMRPGAGRRADAPADPNATRQAWHLVRGHFAEYAEDRPLFGVPGLHGKFWRPAHPAGTRLKGVILKDYTVEAPEATP